MKNDNDSSPGIIFWMGIVVGFAMGCLVFIYKDIPNKTLIENNCGYYNSVNGKFTFNNGETRKW